MTWRGNHNRRFCTTDAMSGKQLFPYQREDIEELKKHHRHILGSDPGVGKTTEVLHMCKELDFASVLIVCPKRLIPEWEYQIEDWLGKEYLDYFTILNYEKLRNRDLANTIANDGFDLICFDECHKLKNRKAKQTRGAFTATSKLTQRVVLMSGTPMQNNPEDLYPLLHIVDTPTFSSATTFIDRYCDRRRLPKPPFPIITVGVKNAKELQAILSKHMLRRRKADVLPWLKKPLHHMVPVVLEGRQLEQYKQMEKELFVLLDSGEKITAPAVTAQIVRLRQICLEPNLLSSSEKRSTPSAKTQTVIELLDNLDGPVVLFSYFEQYISLLAEELTKTSIPHMSFTGKTSKTDKQAVYDAFRPGGKTPKLLMGTITSLGEGLNLQKSHHVLFTDWWYNPAVNDQAWQRLERIGQEYAVEIHDLWARSTIEDAVHRIDKRKRAWISQVVATTQTIRELREMRKES